MTTRYVIQGRWSGNNSNEQHIVHQSVHAAAEKRLRTWVEKTNSIQFADGTFLTLAVRDCKPRERVEKYLGYMTLIKDCFEYDANNVNDLAAKKLKLSKSTFTETAE